MTRDSDNLRQAEAALYTLEKDGSIKTRIDVADLCNGLAWTADNKTMYFIDSMPKNIYVFDYDAVSGDICKYSILMFF